jgi:hypothetical protein
VKPSETYAIVVGIEKYSISEKWNLNGPAIDAAKFVAWLRKRGVPADHIKFFADPLEENKNAEELLSLDVPCKPANGEGIVELFASKFMERRGDVLFLFWGGHGVMSAGAHHLFLANVKERYLVTFKVETLLELLRSTSVPSFSKQVVLIDACANYFELQQSPTSLVDASVPPGVPRAAISQFVIFAAGRGERAKNLGALRMGQFSSILLEELKKPSGEWPPDMQAVQSSVEAQFVALRADGKASQTPVFFYYRDWAGKEAIRYASDQPDLGPAEQDLADALIDCPVMRTPSSRQIVLGQLVELGIQTAKSIPPIPDRRIHVEVIVSVLSRSGDRGALIDKVVSCEEPGKHIDRLMRVRLEIEQQLFDHASVVQLRELLGPLQLPQSDVLRAFRECAGNLTIAPSQEVGEPHSILMTLAGFPYQRVGFPIPALLFAEKVANFIPPLEAAKLRKIVDRIAAQRRATEAIRDFRTGVAWRSTGGEAILVFEIKPKADGYALRASLLDADGLWTVLPTDDHPVTEKGAREKFRDLVYHAEQHSAKLIIEMVVPREMFCWPVDRWEIDVGGFDAVVGAYYPVVLRWLDRLRDERLQGRWSTKWQAVRTYRGAPLWLRSSDQFQPSQLLAMLGQAPETGTFVTFAFPPTRVAERSGDALTVALSGGTPVAVWWRECDPDPKIAQKELESLLTYDSLRELPDLLRMVRNQAEQLADPKHPGCRLALLFDNHDHRPPQLAG